MRSLQTALTLTAVGLFAIAAGCNDKPQPAEHAPVSNSASSPEELIRRTVERRGVEAADHRVCPQ